MCVPLSVFEQGIAKKFYLRPMLIEITIITQHFSLQPVIISLVKNGTSEVATKLMPFTELVVQYDVNLLISTYMNTKCLERQSKWRGSATARLLGLQVRIPPNSSISAS